MRMTGRFVACALILAAASAPAQDSLPETGPGSFEAETVDPPALLREAVARWTAAEESEDAARIAAMYAPDGWFQPACARLAAGREAVSASWRAILSHSPATLSLNPHIFDVARGRDMAIERGQAQFLQNVGGLPYGTNVGYVRVWRRQGGEWLIAADSFGPGGPCGPREN